MLASALFYIGAVAAIAGLVMSVKPIARFRIHSRRRALALAAGGLLTAGGALMAPASEARVVRAATRLDEFVPVWQFRELHSRRIDASPAAAYAALRRVRRDDILLFQTLTWIRRGGRSVPPGMLNAGNERPIIDVALSGGFVLLADDGPRELVIGAIVDAPTGASRPRSADIIRQPPAGYSVAVMNFLLTPDGSGTIVSTETRVFSNGPETRRRFARYWRMIYPGSALIRRMWLRAIDLNSQ